MIDYKQKLKEQGLELLSKFTRVKDVHDYKCMACGHEFSAILLGKLQGFKKYGKSGCPKCNRLRIKSRTNVAASDIVSKLKGNYAIVGKYSPINIADHSYTTVIENTDCGHRFEVYLPSFVKGDMVCNICNGGHKSILKLLHNIGITGMTLGKTNNYVYMKNERYKIIFCDVYQMNESNVGKYFMQYIKNDNGPLRKLFIFSDELENKPKMIKRKIEYIMGRNDLPTIFARKTIIKIVDNDIKNKFLNNNHIQGACASSVNLGAYIGDKLVAIMTFCSPRVLMNRSQVGNPGVWELTRYATDNCMHVVGTASKLLSYFKNNYQWNEIYSFADLRWSDGNMYTKLGFDLVKVNGPEYFYVIDGVRKHRWAFRKDAIRERYPQFYDSTKTEYEMMKAMKIDRVWDCGTLKFSMTNLDNSDGL